ncbi:MAG: hypothetical protein PHT32_07565, partial [Candidatus Omnitrophica bacterium]|nr:hypothetical protein [Candidatus Omnitrophota bacterium]
MDWQSAHNRGWIRIIAILIVICFIHQDIVWAQGGSPVWSKGSNGTFNVNTKIDLPKDVAVTKEVHTGSSPKTIINIQDAHSSIGAQESIVSILDSLVTNYDIKLLAIEGSTGLIDTSLLKSFPDENIRNKTAKYLMNKSSISAGEFFSVTSNKNITLYGIEEKSLYRDNVSQFKAIYEINNSTKKDLNNLISTLKAIQDKLYSDDLKALENNSVLHRDGSISFTQRWDFVRNLAESKGVSYKSYSNISKLVESLRLEKVISFDKANKERDVLIDVLSKKLPKSDLEKLVLKSLAFKSGKIGQGEYYIFLQDLAKNQGISPEPYPNLIQYTDYIMLYESIDLVEIFEEAKEFEDAVKDKLFTTFDQRKLRDYSKCASFV